MKTGLGLGLGSNSRSSAVAWTPASLGAKVLFWLRADLGVATTTWTDQVNGHVFSGTTVTSDNSGINGKARVTFPNLASHDLSWAAGAVTSTKAQGFAVGKIAGTFTNSLWGMGQGSGDFFPFNGNDIYEDFGSSARYGPQASALVIGTPFAYEVKADASGNWNQILNGTNIQTKTGNTVGWRPTGLSVGCDIGGVTHMNGEIEEMLVCTDNLTAGEHASRVAYVLSRYGIAA